MSSRQALTLVISVLACSLVASAVLAQDPPQDELALNRILVARSVVDREPQGTEGPFEQSNDRIYLFLDILNRTGAEQELTVVWQLQGEDRAHETTVTAGMSRRWRTWVTLRLNQRRVGQWHVEVRTAGGQVLGAQDFVVVDR